MAEPGQDLRLGEEPAPVFRMPPESSLVGLAIPVIEVVEVGDERRQDLLVALGREPVG